MANKKKEVRKTKIRVDGARPLGWPQELSSIAILVEEDLDPDEWLTRLREAFDALYRHEYRQTKGVFPDDA